jgi:hypothetical protein
MAILNLGWFCIKKRFMEKGKRRWFRVPMGVLPWKMRMD